MINAWIALRAARRLHERGEPWAYATGPRVMRGATGPCARSARMDSRRVAHRAVDFGSPARSARTINPPPTRVSITHPATHRAAGPIRHGAPNDEADA